MVKRIDYTLELIEAARSVLLEIMRVLGEYQDEVEVDFLAGEYRGTGKRR